MEQKYANDLNYGHLRYFYAVASEGGLRQASAKLHVSQSSICTQIRQLEETLGGKLFRQSGRTLQLSELGQSSLGHAAEIFELGAEIASAARTATASRRPQLHVGVVDAFPKLMSYELLKPAFRHRPEVRVTCQEGKLPDLLALLQTHRLDLVIADEPASSGEASRFFNHELGGCGMSFCAAPELARTCKGSFPGNIRNAPVLLPTQNCILRRELEKWYHGLGIRPRVVAEFEDPALAKICASDGMGYIVVPTEVAADTMKRYGLKLVGKTMEVTTSFYVITAERKTDNAVVAAITGRLQKRSK